MIGNEMYDIEVYVLNKVSIIELLKHREKLEAREGEISYSDKIIRLNLTGIWDLADGDYNAFLDEIIIQQVMQTPRNSNLTIPNNPSHKNLTHTQPPTQNQTK